MPTYCNIKPVEFEGFSGTEPAAACLNDHRKPPGSRLAFTRMEPSR